MNVSELKRVGIEMAASGLPYEFVLRAVILSQDYEGIAGLLRMWAATEDANERDETVVAIQELIDDVEDAPRAVAVPCVVPAADCVAATLRRLRVPERTDTLTLRVELQYRESEAITPSAAVRPDMTCALPIPVRAP